MISKRDLLNSINLTLEEIQFLINANDIKVKEIKNLELDNVRQQTQIIELKSQNRQLQNQLQCAAKGHNFIFKKKEKLSLYDLISGQGIYQFKCENCNLTITKTVDELTVKEKKALKDLGILEEKDVKNSKTKTTN